MIPKGCKFAVFDKEFKVIKTDLKGENLKQATLYAKGIDRKMEIRKVITLLKEKMVFVYCNIISK